MAAFFFYFFFCRLLWNGRGHHSLLPQCRQFGADVWSAWRVALQPQGWRGAVGFVELSSARMAASRSAMLLLTELVVIFNLVCSALFRLVL